MDPGAFQPMTNTAAAPRFTFNACRTLRLRLPLLSLHDGHGGCAARHFQPMTNNAAAPRFTFNPCRTLRLRRAAFATHDEHCGCASHHFQRRTNTAPGLPGLANGPAQRMAAACLRDAQVSKGAGRDACRGCLWHACGMPAGMPAACRHASGMPAGMPAGCAGMRQQACDLLAQASKVDRMPECLP